MILTGLVLEVLDSDPWACKPLRRITPECYTNSKISRPLTKELKTLIIPTIFRYYHHCYLYPCFTCPPVLALTVLTSIILQVSYLVIG